MPGFDGLGNYDRAHDWTDDQAADIDVRADRMDEEFDTMATAFENCLTRDNQGKPSTDQDFNNKKITNLADPTTAKGALNVQTAQAGAYHYTLTTGSSNAYAGSLVPSITALTNGMSVLIKANHSNTGASTFNLSGLGAKNIYLEGNALVGGEIIADSIYKVVFNLAQNRWDLQKTLLKDASETVKGVVELATNAETITGTDTVRATHPAGVYAAIADKVLVLGNLSGLRTEQDTDLDHDIKINIGAVLNSSKDTVIKLTSSLVKRIDANWSAGTGNGGFPSGISLSANTWYHFFLIYNPTTGITDAGWDTSLSATNLLTDATGYTKYRRIWSHLTDSSSNIRDYYHRANWCYWKDFVEDFNSTIGTTATLITVSTPLGLDSLVKIIGNTIRGGASNNLLFSSPYQTDTAVTTNIKNIFDPLSQDKAIENMIILTNTSSQIRGRAGANSSSVVVITYAYYDFLEN